MSEGYVVTVMIMAACGVDCSGGGGKLDDA